MSYELDYFNTFMCISEERYTPIPAIPAVEIHDKDIETRGYWTQDLNK